MVDHSIRPVNPAPSLHPHYRDFFTITSWSAPVPRIGTLTLMGPPLEFLPYHRDDRFPRSVQKPGSRSRHLYAGCRTGSKQVPPVLILEPRKNPSFDTAYICFDTSSVVRLRSSPRSSPATILSRDFSLTLTTLALYQRSLRWFEACSCKPAPRGQTLISCTVTCGYKLILY
jgi:hypothetical protein